MIDDLTRKVLRLEARLDSLIKPEVPLHLIDETVLAGSVASVTFSSIPQHFRSLILIVQARTDYAAEGDNVVVRFNADSGANYDYIRYLINSGGNTVASARAQTGIVWSLCEGANSRASNYAQASGIMPGYSKAEREKWISDYNSGRFGDVSADTDLYMMPALGRWRNTDAITSITMLPLNGTNFVSGSIFQLYGLA